MLTISKGYVKYFSKLALLSMNNEFGVDTAFKVKDNFGRTLYLKNLMSNVIILQLNSDRESAFAFRNTPSFYGDNPDLKDALYETDAGLDHYFYHHNTGKEGKMRQSFATGYSYLWSTRASNPFWCRLRLLLTLVHCVGWGVKRFRSNLIKVPREKKRV